VREEADRYAAKVRDDATRRQPRRSRRPARRARIDDEIKELDGRRDAALERMESLRQSSSDDGGSPTGGDLVALHAT